MLLFNSYLRSVFQKLVSSKIWLLNYIIIEVIVIYASSWLQSNKSPRDFAEELMGEADHFGGFNLIVVDICSMTMFYITNRPKDRGVSATEVLPGIHVLTNASLDSPWPKVTKKTYF